MCAVGRRGGVTRFAAARHGHVIVIHLQQKHLKIHRKDAGNVKEPVFVEIDGFLLNRNESV